MKKLLIALALTAPALGLIGCQDNTELEDQIAAMRAEMRDMKTQSGDKSDSSDAQPVSNNADINGMEIRIGNRIDKMGKNLNERIDGLDNQPVAADGTVSTTSKSSQAEFDRRWDDRKAREEIVAEAKRKAAAEQAEIELEERKANAEKIAEENGFDFDANDPIGSGMKLWGNPENRPKLIEIMRNEGVKARLKKLDLTETQTKDVLRIEKDNRTKVRDSVAAARERGDTTEQIKSDLEYIQEEKDRELEGVLDETQLEEYKKSEGSGMLGGMGDISKMIPPGMIPGMGGMGGEDQ